MKTVERMVQDLKSKMGEIERNAGQLRSMLEEQKRAI